MKNKCPKRSGNGGCLVQQADTKLKNVATASTVLVYVLRCCLAGDKPLRTKGNIEKEKEGRFHC